MPVGLNRRITDYDNELKNELDINWHKIEIEKLCLDLHTNIETGLTRTEAKYRLSQNGLNALTTRKTTLENWKIVKSMFVGFLPLMWICALLCFAIYIVESIMKYDTLEEDYLTVTIVLLVVILITGFCSYYQTLCRSRLMESFKNLIPQYATVYRESKHQTILAEELVVGDIIEIKFGDRVPADLRVFETHNLKVDNSVLTGDPNPQVRSDELTHDNPLETKNLAFCCTNVIEGKSKGIVVACGDNTVMGRIAYLVTSIEKNDAPIVKELRYLVRMINYLAIFMGVIVLLLSLMANHGFVETSVCLVGMFVANVPEGLLPTITAGLTLRAKRLLKQNCHVKNIELIETLGATSVICTDKTGTLTQNRMTVSHLWLNNIILEADTSNTQENMQFNMEDETFRAIIRCAILCNSAEFKGGQQGKPIYKKEISGNNSDAALLKFTEIVTRKTKEMRRNFQKAAEIHFNSKDKFQLSIHINDTTDEDCKYLLFMKGAPERVFEFCTTIYIDGRNQPITKDIQENFRDTCIRFSGMGERVLGFCDYALPPDKFHEDYEFETHPKPNFPLSGYRFLGLISMIDPPRATVPNAVAKCRTAGIKVIMVTGDHPVAAKAIAKSVGIITQPTIEEIAFERQISLTILDPFEAKACIVHGALLRQLSDYELDIIISYYTEIVFARMTPQQKLRIVESCHRNGHIVTVSGNGVNDAPALRVANVSVSLAIVSSEVSRQAADILLLDDNFSSIVDGIEEGRIIHENLKKLIAYVLTSNMPEIMAVWVFVILGMPLPLSILAMLCIDLGTDIIPAISLTYEKPESDVMKRAPTVRKVDCLFNSNLILMAYFQIGVIQFAAGFFTYFAVMSEYGFRPHTLIGLHADWDDSNKDDLQDFFGQQWTYHERKNLEYTCQTAFFVSIVVVQWANLIICKTLRNSIIQQGMRNHLLNFALVFETLMAILLTYVPGMKKSLNMFPQKLHWWLFAVPFAIFIVIHDEVLRFILREYPNHWIEQEIYY